VRTANITHCNTLQRTAPHCTTHVRTHCNYNTLQHTATHCCNTLQHTATMQMSGSAHDRGRVNCIATLQHTATHCNTLQHTATHCITLQHTATHCNTPQHTLQHTATMQMGGSAFDRGRVSACCNTATSYNSLQKAVTNYNTLQHTATTQMSGPSHDRGHVSGSALDFVDCSALNTGVLLCVLRCVAVCCSSL